MNESTTKIAMKPSHPGAFIRAEILDELGLSIARAAGILDVRRATLSALINQKARLSPEMALRIEMAFGLDMDTMLRMQVWHDATEMRERAGQISVAKYEPGP